MTFLVYTYPTVSLCYLHHSHVVLWLQWNLQHFGPVHHPLHAACGDSLPCDSVDLVESVRFQEPLVSCSYKDLQPQWSCALVPTELVRATKAIKSMLHIKLNQL